MKAQDAISKIKVMLGMDTEVVLENETVETTPEVTEIELAEATLVDGTIVKADSFVEGATLVVVTEAGDIPAPVGVHETADGKLITVEVEGVIAKVEDKPAEEQVLEETQEFSSEDFLKSIADLIDSKFNELDAKISSVNEEFHAFKAEPAANKITNNLGEVQKSESDLATARFNKLVEFRNQSKR